jgi:hypothetical protein
MFELSALVTAGFTAPEAIGTNPGSLLWLLPLVAAIAVVYKATKLPTISAGNFLKESILLFFSIIVFMAATALVLSGVAWFVLE